MSSEVQYVISAAVIRFDWQLPKCSTQGKGASKFGRTPQTLK